MSNLSEEEQKTKLKSLIEEYEICYKESKYEGNVEEYESLKETHKLLKDILDLIDRLQKELEQERKLTNLIIDDFQAENYFINMTNKEVREYYSKRKELK